MLPRLGVVLPLILVALFGTGCRSVWREPPPAPWTAVLLSPVADAAVDEGGDRDGLASPPELAAAQDCAARASFADRTGGMDAAADYYQSVCRAWTAVQQSIPSTEAYQRAWTTYHTSLGRLLAVARDEGRLAPGRGVTVNSLGGPMIIPLTLHSSVWRSEDVQAIHPVGEYHTKLLSRQYKGSGWGVPVVVERKARTGQYAEEEFLMPGVMFAATALLRPNAQGGAVLELFDPLHPCLECLEPPSTLARDLSAPFALRVINSPELVNDWLSYFGVDVPSEQGLFFLEPYQRGKIPVVLVHGLLSNPVAWIDMANDLRGSPGFAERFQLWAFRYDTGDPFLEAASRLRRDLGRAVATVDDGSGDPALESIVLVGHSMGGLVSELQACSSEDRLWNAVANRPLAAIATTPETRAALQDMFFFDPQPNVRCVISLAAPHEGSNWAERPIGRLGSVLARPEAWRTARHAQLLSDNPGAFSDEVIDGVPTSVEMLRPESTLLKTMATLPANPCVWFHTVFGFGRTGPLRGVSDGMVAADSALSARASTQTGVDASHSQLHRKLETAGEVLRILDEQWSQLGPSAVASPPR